MNFRRKLAIHSAHYRQKFLEYENNITTEAKLFKKHRVPDGATETTPDVVGGVFGYDDIEPDNRADGTPDPVNEYILIKCIIIWNPDYRKLQSLGFFVDKNLPILGYFPVDPVVDRDDMIELDIWVDGGSTTHTRRLIVTDIKIYGKGAEVKQAVLLAPIRSEESID